MVGIPIICQTRQDWENAIKYAKDHGTGITEMIVRLQHLRDNCTKSVLTHDAETRILAMSVEEREEYQFVESDFHQVEDLAAEKYRLSITDDRINAWIDDLETRR